MNPILEKYYKIKEEHSKALSELENETGRIVKVITKFFECKHYWWSFGYYEGDNAPLPTKVRNGFFDIYIDGDCTTDETDYSNGFPVKFFDMSDDEIVAYLKDEVKRCEESCE